jgi:hypothetical protein
MPVNGFDAGSDLDGRDNRVKVPSFVDHGALASGVRFENEL